MKSQQVKVSRVFDVRGGGGVEGWGGGGVWEGGGGGRGAFLIGSYSKVTNSWRSPNR